MFLKKEIHDQPDGKQQARRAVRLHDVVTLLLQMDATSKDHATEKKIVETLKFLDTHLGLKAELMDNLEHLVDAMLSQTVQGEDDIEVLGDDVVAPPPREDDDAWVPPCRELKECFIVERRKPPVAVPRKESERVKAQLLQGEKEMRVVHLRLGDRVMVPHELETSAGGKKEGEGDQGKAHMWMGTVTSIRQNARGRIMYQVLWDYHFLCVSLSLASNHSPPSQNTQPQSSDLSTTYAYT